MNSFLLLADAAGKGGFRFESLKIKNHLSGS